MEAAKYNYNYGICETNDYPSALAFMEATVRNLGSTPDTDRLIVARHHLLAFCKTKESDLGTFLDELTAILLPLGEKKNYAPWVDYLWGIKYFYEEQFPKAEEKFASAGKGRTGWLRDTTDYMAVRVPKMIVGSFPPASATAVLELERALSDLKVSIRQYVDDHPNGRYLETVRNLDRYVSWMNGDRNALVAATHSNFTRIFTPGAQTSTKQRAVFLEEATNYTGAVFVYPNEADGNVSIHPIAIVAQLLSEIALASEIGNDDPFLEKSPSHVWRKRFSNVKEASVSFPGLFDFFELLLLAHDKKFDDIAHQQISRETFGPLYADVLILRSRALEKVGRHIDAAKLWLKTSREYPTYNGLTEAATAFVRAGKFVEFARIKKSWMTDFAPEKVAVYKYGPYDEFEIDVKSFYAIFQPYRNLLRLGLENTVSSTEAVSLHTDGSLNPIIRFLAAEPSLRASLLTGNYPSFIDTSKRLFDAKFDADWSKSEGGEDADLIAAYRELISQVNALISNPKDPHALIAVGYFLYSKDRFPSCFGELPHWVEYMGMCDGRMRSDVYPKDLVRPIDLFEKALSIYQSHPERTSGEAKVLRILIYCFKGNWHSCVRRGADDHPKSVRKKYFQRLHKYFPREAKRTPYWY